MLINFFWWWYCRWNKYIFYYVKYSEKKLKIRECLKSEKNVKRGKNCVVFCLVLVECILINCLMF